TGFNRYAYCMNNPVVNVDPSGEIAWFIPVIIGAAVGFEIGGLQASGWKEARFWKWDQEEWVSAGIGFMIGAGVGLSYSWGSSALFNNISHIYTGTEGAATTIGWSMGSNAIMTSNINMLSSWAQGREAAEIGLSGGSGFVAGLIGGYVGQQFFPETFNQFSLSQLKATNYITATLNGALDRFTNSTFYNYEPARQVAFNTVLGAGEGLYSAYLGSKNPIASLKAKGIERFAGRYISNAVSQGLTSVPGLGLTIASYHSMYYCWMAMAGNGPDWLSFATAPGLMGLAPPAYAWAINKSLYTSAVINPLFWLTKNFK
ncbi:MAG: hypothetical protein KKD31_17910, partial [Bacteroidetes bacterium]|nr:hypothetical protein [Bacteroidota bacterium]